MRKTIKSMLLIVAFLIPMVSTAPSTLPVNWFKRETTVSTKPVYDELFYKDLARSVSDEHDIYWRMLFGIWKRESLVLTYDPTIKGDYDKKTKKYKAFGIGQIHIKTARDHYSKKAKENWNKMSDSDKYELQKKAAQAVRIAAKEGSKIEKFLLDKLTDGGYNILFHAKIIPQNDMEVDLYLPDLKTVIEIDGPTHFFPIWGETNLQKHVKSDSKKDGLILNSGMVMIRIKYLAKKFSKKHILLFQTDQDKAVLINEIFF